MKRCRDWVTLNAQPTVTESELNDAALAVLEQ
jgi:hypothetical protein